MENYEFIINFFQSIGASKEANMYLKLFKKGNPARFAVIKVGGKVIQDATAMIGADLAYLANLDLFPVVIHGAGPQIDARLAAAGVVSRKKEGMRVTPPAAMEVIREVLEEANGALVASIKSSGGDAVGINRGVFLAEPHADRELGQVGEVVSVDLRAIERAIRRDQIAVVNPIGYGPDGTAYNINADSAARALVLALKPKKLILITEEGGVRDGAGKLISFINLEREFERLVSSGVITGGMLLKVREIKSILDEMKGRLTVTICSARNLVKELFTVKGSGTFLKRGARIRELRSYDDVNLTRLKNLVESSFHKKLARGYFRKPLRWLFLEENYKGAAFVRRVGGKYYLDKFAVRREAQGEGVGSDLWDVMLQRCKKLFWRARPDNPINGWYFAEAHGVRKFAKWYVFWINLSDGEIRRAIRYALALDETLLPHPADAVAPAAATATATATLASGAAAGLPPPAGPRDVV
ncbi:MAG: acetylglutamate kinase [Planctomycetes bacterium]|nr:acetylglutamate kinase [Planctomycetota bacterium]